VLPKHTLFNFHHRPLHNDPLIHQDQGGQPSGKSRTHYSGSLDSKANEIRNAKASLKFLAENVVSVKSGYIDPFGPLGGFGFLRPA
jgi:hypothetical protein